MQQIEYVFFLHVRKWKMIKNGDRLFPKCCYSVLVSRNISMCILQTHDTKSVTYAYSYQPIISHLKSRQLNNTVSVCQAAKKCSFNKLVHKHSHTGRPKLLAGICVLTLANKRTNARNGWTFHKKSPIFRLLSRLLLRRGLE